MDGYSIERKRKRKIECSNKKERKKEKQDSNSKGNISRNMITETYASEWWQNMRTWVGTWYVDASVIQSRGGLGTRQFVGTYNALMMQNGG